MTDPILPPLSRDQRRIAGREVLRFDHRLAETGLFTDEALARLIDGHPRELVTIRTLRPGAAPGEGWIDGAADGLSGAQLVEAVRTGALWVCVRQALIRDPSCKAVFEPLMEAFSGQTGVAARNADGAVVISSPRMAVPFHVDPAEKMLWHVRGHKTLMVYPPRTDLLPEARLEAAVLGGALSDLPWTPAAEDHALPVSLAAGQAAYWPRHSPHRVVNDETLNVSISVEFASPGSRLANAVLYTHGRMRRTLGWAPPSRGLARLVSPAYLALAGALKAWAPLAAGDSPDPAVRFDVDPAAPDGLRWRDGMAPDWARPAKARPVRKTARRKAALLKAA